MKCPFFARNVHFNHEKSRVSEYNNPLFFTGVRHNHYDAPVLFRASTKKPFWDLSNKKVFFFILTVIEIKQRGVQLWLVSIQILARNCKLKLIGTVKK